MCLVSSRQNGNALTEFVFVFPATMALFLCSLDLSVMAVQRLKLESVCLRAARQLSLSALKTSSEMESLFPNSQVQIRTLATVPQTNPLRQIKKVEIIEITLKKKVTARFPLMTLLLREFPLEFSSRAQAVRIREKDAA
jgi:hypothetical protein